MKKQIIILTFTFVLLLLNRAFAIDTNTNKTGLFKRFKIGDTTIKFGIDTSSKYQTDTDWLGISERERYDIDDSVSLSLESIFLEFTRLEIALKKLEIGAGFTYQNQRYTLDNGSFFFIPVYGLIKFCHVSSKVAPYFINQFGYNYFNADSYYERGRHLTFAGGPYYGVGVGVKIHNAYQIELLFSRNYGKTTDDLSGFPVDIKHTKITYSIGIIF